MFVGISCSVRHHDNPSSVEFSQPVLVIAPGQGTQDFDPTAPVAVHVFNTVLNTVTMQDDNGAIIKGIFTSDKHSWQPIKQLKYGHKYTIAAKTQASLISPELTQTSTFTTAIPSNKTRVYFRTSGGMDVHNNDRYGVGIVVVAHFDEPITNHALAEKYLIVQSTPPVVGSWYWTDNQNVHWRPKDFYPAGTSVTISANIVGQQLGSGLYGEMNTSVHFTIGPRHYSIADDKTHIITSFDNRKVVRVMPTSMGAGGYIKGAGGINISLYTPPGIYTVVGRGNPVIMDSSSFGLPVHSRLGYKEKINFATRISNDGIYIHQLDSTVWAQGHTDTSHGCLNLNHDNAEWFYKWSLDGDPVEVKNTGGPKLTQAQNGDWTIPWDQWLRGSALFHH